MLGKVSTVSVRDESNGRQNIEAIMKTSPGGRISGSARWLLQSSVNPIQNGDLICLLQRALRPTIIRLRKDHFTTALIAAELPKNLFQRMGTLSGQSLHNQRHLFETLYFLGLGNIR